MDQSQMDSVDPIRQQDEMRIRMTRLGNCDQDEMQLGNRMTRFGNCDQDEMLGNRLGLLVAMKDSNTMSQSMRNRQRLEVAPKWCCCKKYSYINNRSTRQDNKQSQINVINRQKKLDHNQ